MAQLQEALAAGVKDITIANSIPTGMSQLQFHQELCLEITLKLGLEIKL